MSRSPPSRSPVPSVPDGRKREEDSSCSSGQDQRREEDRRGRLEPQGTEGTVPSLLARKGFSLGNAGSAAVLAGNSPRRAPPDVEWRGVARCRMAERPRGAHWLPLVNPGASPQDLEAAARFRPPGEAGSINAALAAAVRATRIERSRQPGPECPRCSRPFPKPGTGRDGVISLHLPNNLPPVPLFPLFPKGKREKGTGVFLCREQSGRTETGAAVPLRERRGQRGQRGHCPVAWKRNDFPLGAAGLPQP